MTKQSTLRRMEQQNAMRQPAAIIRCDQCDNGVEMSWNYCAWCGAIADWIPPARGERDQSR